MSREAPPQPEKPTVPAAPVAGIILASASPRRKELLEGLGVDFTVIPPEVDEKSLDVTHLSPDEIVTRLAHFKGQSVAREHPDALVIAADTIVVVDGDVLEKPVDRDDAFRMLKRLEGTRHSVFSAVAVFVNGKFRVEAMETRVWMQPLSEETIWRYIDTGEPMDKAGAYAIQGYGSVLIERIEGCYFNVVGLSMVLLERLCRELGKPLVF